MPEASLPGRQRQILTVLRDRAHGATLDEIAASLSVTRTAAMAQLSKLLDLGLASHEDERGSVGRPRRRYLISPAGLESFPRQYSWLSNLLLEDLAQRLGRKGSGALMRRLGSRLAASMRERFDGESPALRLRQVAKVLTELGYQAAPAAGPAKDGPVLEAVNCVYHAVAQQHPELCEFDVAFIGAATGQPVALQSCIARGGHSCRFKVGAKDAG
jgi:predicted ArsR family transcriptional regulator